MSRQTPTDKINEIEKTVVSLNENMKTVDSALKTLIKKHEQFVDEYHKTEVEKYEERETDRKTRSPTWIQIIGTSVGIMGCAVAYIQFNDTMEQKRIDQALAPYVLRIDQTSTDLKELNLRLDRLEATIKITPPANLMDTIPPHAPSGSK